MSTEVKEEDIYGQVILKETSELISTNLEKLDEELERIPNAEKVAWALANERCPQFITKEFKLKFLRCEIFDATLAAKRIINYWHKRFELFKEPNAFKPMKLGHDGAFTNEHDDEALKSKLIRVPGTKDQTGRPIIFFDPSQGPLKGTYDIDSYIRAFWYCLHSITEDTTAQQKGILFIAYPKHTKFSQFDRKRMTMMIESIKGALPVRISAFHLCHPPVFFEIVFPIVKLLMGKKLRKKIKIHSGSDEKVLEKLVKKYSFDKASLPSEIGGDLILDHDKWLEDRKNKNL